MANKKVKEEEVKETILENSTVVLNDDAEGTPIEDTTTDTLSEGDDCKHDKDCTCEWGKCPKDTCERYYQNPNDVPTSQEFIYHLNTDGSKTEIKKANPNYKKEETPDPTPDPTPVDPKPEPKPEPTPDVPSNDCGDEQEEPWAHDKVGDLREELRLHTGSVYNVVDAWLESLANETDDEKRAEIISHIAWHIPTGGPNSIKVHHKAKIVELLKAYKG